MDLPSIFGPFWESLIAWVATWPRTLGFFVLLPVFKRDLFPGLLKITTVAGFTLPLIPMMQPQFAQLSELGGVLLATHILKELIIGFSMAFPILLFFWLAESVGALIDNQSGLSVASVINPASGNEVAVWGGVLQHFCVALFVILGGLAFLLSLLYQSFVLWPIYTWWPKFNQVSMAWWLELFAQYMEFTVSLAAPVLIAIFLTDLSFGVMGKFASKMQIFILAMPIKHLVALCILFVYFLMLTHHFTSLIDQLKDSVLSIGAIIG